MHCLYVTPAKLGGSHARLGPGSIWKVKYFKKSQLQGAVKTEISDSTYPGVGVFRRAKKLMCGPRKGSGIRRGLDRFLASPSLQKIYYYPRQGLGEVNLDLNWVYDVTMTSQKMEVVGPEGQTYIL